MIVQNRKYPRTLTLLAVSLLLSIYFAFFTSAQELPVYDVKQTDKPPRYLRKVDPIYPFCAERPGLKGWIKIRCIVGTDGLPTKIEALEADPEDILELFGPPCVNAVKEWRFIPGEIGGDSVQTRVAFRIMFDLGEEPHEVNP